MSDINNRCDREVSPRLRQDMLAHDGELPARHASGGRMFLGFCLTAAAPAVSWVLADAGIFEPHARIIALSVLVAGVLLVSVGSMARFGYNGADHHVFGL